MADITMCRGKGCPMANDCYRHTAPRSLYRQSMFAVEPIKEDGTCEYYWNKKLKK